MDKRLILAVAGSGKTRTLIEKLDTERRTLIVTHTNNNQRNIRFRIIKKFGYLPNNISIQTYFSFLYGSCFKPFLLNKTGVKGLNYNPCRNRYAKGRDRFIDANNRAYSNRIVKLIQDLGVEGDINDRISKYYDLVMIDEIQDFAGNDFNLLPTVVSAETEILFVGDFFQHTFDTSRDGAVNGNLHNDYDNYVKRFADMGLTVDTETLSHSHRCSPIVCGYIRDNLGISISSHRGDAVNIVSLESAKQITDVYKNSEIVKLFYQNSHKYSCYSRNWGASKGEDHYHDVCIVLNDNSYKKMQKGELHSLPSSTRNKLYVAVTRSRGDLYFIEEKALKKLL